MKNWRILVEFEIEDVRVDVRLQKYSIILSPWFFEYPQDFFQKWVSHWKHVNNLKTGLKTLLESAVKFYSILSHVEEKWKKYVTLCVTP